MNTKHWNLLRFFVLLVLWTVAGAIFSSLVRGSFVTTYYAGSGFRWVNMAIILIAAGAFGGYWLYMQQAALTSARMRLRASFAFHLGAFGLILLGIGIYALVDKPINNGWILLMAGWGVVVITHGLLARCIQDAPEDIFV